MQNRTSPLMVLNSHEGRTAAALFEHFFPADENGPGATEIGVLTYVDRALSGAYRDRAETYRLGLAALDRAARDRYGTVFADCDLDQRDALVADLEREALSDFRVPPQGEFFALLRNHVREGLFSDPAHGGNREKLGWRFLGHPGVWLEHTAEENLAEGPVTKGGEIRSLEDAGFSLGGDFGEPVEIPGYDPQRSAEPPLRTRRCRARRRRRCGRPCRPDPGARRPARRRPGGRTFPHPAGLRARRARLRLLCPGRYGA